MEYLRIIDTMNCFSEVCLAFFFNINFILQGQYHEIFYVSFFSSIIFTQAPDLIFFRKFATIFVIQRAESVSTTPSANWPLVPDTWPLI
jgi:hypothetical protein